MFATKFTQKPGAAAAPVVTDAPVQTQPTVTEPPVTAPPVTAASDIIDGQIYTFKNVNSGLYLDIEGGNGANGANLQQAANDGKASQFKAVSAGNGYYYLVSQLGDGNSYALDINGKKTTDGANVELYTFNKGDNQQFKFVKNNDGSYAILTKITGDASALDVNEQSKNTGANVQQYKYSGGANQKFILEAVNAQAAEPTTTAAPVVTEIPTVTQAPPTQQAATLWGDTNCNGEVNVADVVVLNRLLNDPSYIVKNPDTKADVTAQGKVNADVVAPQSKDGKNIDPATVKLTAADSEAIAMYILEKGSIPTD